LVGNLTDRSEYRGFLLQLGSLLMKKENLPVTLFAPNAQALSAVKWSDVPDTKHVLLYHIVRNANLTSESEETTDLMVRTMLTDPNLVKLDDADLGQWLHVHRNLEFIADGLTNDTQAKMIKVAQKDIVSKEGTINIIDSLLTIPRNLSSLLQEGNLTEFYNAAQNLSGFMDAVENLTSITVFIPNNEAMTKFMSQQQPQAVNASANATSGIAQEISDFFTELNNMISSELRKEVRRLKRQAAAKLTEGNSDSEAAMEDISSDIDEALRKIQDEFKSRFGNSSVGKILLNHIVKNVTSTADWENKNVTGGPAANKTAESESETQEPVTGDMDLDADMTQNQTSAAVNETQPVMEGGQLVAKLHTLGGGILEVKMGEDGNFTVNGAKILVPDIVFANGALHVIDAVFSNVSMGAESEQSGDGDQQQQGNHKRLATPLKRADTEKKTIFENMASVPELSDSYMLISNCSEIAGFRKLLESVNQTGPSSTQSAKQPPGQNATQPSGLSEFDEFESGDDQQQFQAGQYNQSLAKQLNNATGPFTVFAVSNTGWQRLFQHLSALVSAMSQNETQAQNQTAQPGQNATTPAATKEEKAKKVAEKIQVPPAGPPQPSQEQQQQQQQQQSSVNITMPILLENLNMSMLSPRMRDGMFASLLYHVINSNSILLESFSQYKLIADTLLNDPNFVFKNGQPQVLVLVPEYVQGGPSQPPQQQQNQTSATPGNTTQESDLANKLHIKIQVGVRRATQGQQQQAQQGQEEEADDLTTGNATQQMPVSEQEQQYEPVFYHVYADEIVSSNGVLYVIDDFLVPPMPFDGILEYNNFTQFLEALNNTGVMENLSQANDSTLLVPVSLLSPQQPVTQNQTQPAQPPQPPSQGTNETTPQAVTVPNVTKEQLQDLIIQGTHFSDEWFNQTTPVQLKTVSGKTLLINMLEQPGQQQQQQQPGQNQTQPQEQQQPAGPQTTQPTFQIAPEAAAQGQQKQNVTILVADIVSANGVMHLISHLF